MFIAPERKRMVLNCMIYKWHPCAVSRRLIFQNQRAFMPLRMGVRVVGSYGVSGSIPSRQTLDALGSLIAVAIERAGTVEKLARAEIARESEQLRSALLDSLTHEFRTPLTAVKASVTSLLSSTPIDEAQREELLTIINEESDRLNRLVGEATEMAQLDAHSVQLNLHSHAIREAVDDAMEQSKQALRHHPVKINLPDDLPMVRMDLARSQRGSDAAVRECREIFSSGSANPHYRRSKKRDANDECGRSRARD